MKKGYLVLGIVLIVLLALGMGIASSYNSLVSMETAVDSSWAEVENLLQNRADLIPNLVATVKGYASHEEGVFTEIANARSRLIAAGSAAEALEANRQLESALSRLLVIIEQYPQLKADSHFTYLMDELTTTENKIVQGRRRYNQSVEAWNVKIKQFPTVIIANLFGKETRPFFEARPGAEEVPQVQF